MFFCLLLPPDFTFHFLFFFIISLNVWKLWSSIPNLKPLWQFVNDLAIVLLFFYDNYYDGYNLFCFSMILRNWRDYNLTGCFWTVWTLISFDMMNTKSEKEFLFTLLEHRLGSPKKLCAWPPRVLLQASECPNELSPQSGCSLDCATEDVPNTTATQTCTQKQGLVRLLTGLGLDLWYWSVGHELISNSYRSLHCFEVCFPCRWDIVFIGCILLFWLLLLLLLFMIIICHQCLLKIGTLRFVCLNAVAEKK